MKSQALSGDELLDTLLFGTNIVGIFVWDFDGRILQANDAFLRIVGYEREDLVAGRMRWPDLTPPDLLDRQAERIREHMTTGRLQPFEKEYVRKDGSRVPVLVGVSRFEGGLNQGVGFVLDVTGRKRAEEEHRAHVWFLESMDRIHRAIQGTNDLETMINAVLEEVRDIFQSDRAALSIFGTRSGTAWYRAPLAIKLRPGCEHPDKVGLESVADEDSTAMRLEVRAAGRPVQMVLGSVPAHVARVHAHFGAQSVLSMAIEARHAGLEYDHFYYFTVDECSHRRVWTAEEMRLFEEIGRRLGDALTRLSTLGELQRRDAYLSEAQRLSHTASWAWNAARNEFVHWSRGRLPLLGPDSGEFPTFEKVRQSIHPEDRDAWSERFERAMRERSQFELEYRSELPDGRVGHFRTVAHPVLDGSGELLEFVGTVVDITAEKHAEAERRAHVWFLESMDRINRAMQTNDLEKMMGDVLDAVLEIFGSDRAWLLYPCDPDAPSWRPVMERTRAEFPGAASRADDLPMTAESAAVAQTALASARALLRGGSHEMQPSREIAEQFGVRSDMLMALHPKGDRPYLFGLHQCSHPRTWTHDEQRLFEDIGHRLTDALTSLIAFRSLRESEARLEAAQRVAHIGWWERDYATGHVSLSDEACRIFGVQPLDLPHWHGRWLSLIHPDDRPKTAEASEKALRGDARYEVEYRVVRPDGAVRVVHSQGDVTRDESGRAIRQFGVLQDITELRQAEREVRARQDMLELAQKAARAVAFDWRIGSGEGENRWSPELEEMYGLEPGTFERTYQGWRKLIHPDDWPSVKQALEHAHRTGDVAAEYRVIRKDGAVRWLQAKGRMFFDAERRPERMVGFMIDVTDRRQAEEEVRAAEARFRTFVDHATDAFFLHDERLAIVDANRQACESLGYRREELIGMHPRDFDVGLSADSFARLAERVSAGETVTFETLHRRKDATVFPVEIRVREFRQGGRRLHLSLARDISERKAADEALRSKDDALQMARTELARVSRVTTLGELTASIAHEVNQPLGAMVTNAAACTRWLGAKPPDMEEARAALANIVADGKRAGEVISRIRALTKRQMPRTEPLDVNRKVLEVLALAEHELKSHEIVLRTQLAPKLPRVAGDRVQFQQVLLNLIVNAMDAMSVVRDRPRELTIVSATNGADAVVVEVRDSGPGLDAEAAERVFEPFYTTKPQGLGIGLSISRSIVEAHGGRLWVNPNEPQGAIFRFTLPLAPEDIVPGFQSEMRAP